MKLQEFRIASAAHAATGDGADRLSVARRTDGLVLALADGAGNDARGAALAEHVCETVKARALEAPALPDAKTIATWLSALDEAATAGETTAVVVATDGSQVWGASVGDSCAWMVRADSYDELTARQRRKPLLGSRQAPLERFGPVPLRGALLLGSDGLFTYALEARIRHEATTGNLSVGVAKLVDLVRLPSGALRDDVAVILCRRVQE